MRKPIVIALILAVPTFAPAQQGRPKTADQTPPRFGVSFRGKTYTQATPKEALASVLEAADKGEFNYLAAHLLEPGFVDARIAERGRELFPRIETQLTVLRDYQQKNRDRFDPEVRVPVEPARFRDRVAADTQAAAFRLFVRDVQDKFAEDPQVLKDLRRFLNQGTFPDKADGETAKVGLADVRDREVFFKKIGDRWYLENRQTDEKPPETPESKKE